MIVVDSSAAVDYLIARDQGEWVESQIAADESLHAPHLLDIEVANALRRFVQLGELAEERARQALRDLSELDVARYPHVPFLGRIWQLRDNVTAHDAVYVALAEELGATLVTTDARLSRAPGLRAVIVTP